MKQKDIGNLWKVGIKKAKMAYVDWRIRAPFAELLEGREFHNPMKFIDPIQKEKLYHIDIEGESPLSIGTFYELMHDGFKPKNNVNISGIFHVGPWMCMQETTATAKINAMKNNYDGDSIAPIIHASFGETSNPNFDSELAVFREQCKAENNRIVDLEKVRKEYEQ